MDIYIHSQFACKRDVYKHLICSITSYSYDKNLFLDKSLIN